MNRPARPVPQFEARLLRILDFFLQRAPREQALPLVLQPSARPRCLTRAGVELVQDRLAKGCVRLLARGGWRRERHLRGERIAAGRLWERTPPGELGLAFSGHALEFLVWITAARSGDPKPRWQPPEAELTPADQFLLYLAYTALRDSEPANVLRKLPPFARNALCRLAYPEEFAFDKPASLPEFGPWTAGAGACILEALQPELARNWLALERHKAEVSDARWMRTLGTAQEALLGAILPALDRAGRHDLARFLLQAAAGLLTEDATGALWTGALQWTDTPPLSERAEVYRAALAFVRCLGELRRWERRARGVGYFDEGYAAAQLWKADWERHDGDRRADRADDLVRRLDPMNLSGGASS